MCWVRLEDGPCQPDKPQCKGPETSKKLKITIPASVEDAVTALSGVEALLTAKEWERAAIVAAFVTLDNKPGPKSSATSSRTPEGFAALGIAGLKSKDTVRRYVEVWQSTDRPRPTPGQPLDLDGLPPFPGTWGRTNVDHTKTQPGNVAAALADPVFRQKVIDRADENTRRKISQEAVQSIMEDHVTRTGGSIPTREDINAQPSPFPVLDGIADVMDLDIKIANAAAAFVALVEQRGPIPDGHDLHAVYFNVQMSLSMMLTSTAAEGI